MKRLYIISFILALIIFSFQKINAQNEPLIWDGVSVASAFSSGNGSSTSPYIISNPSELAFLAQQVNKGLTYNGLYFLLQNNLDLNNHLWTPIGNANNANDIKSFQGFFDGNGKQIFNLYVNLTKVSGNGAALFGATGLNSIIKNLNISVGGNVNAFQYVGGIVGYCMGSVTNCTNAANVSAISQYAGGIAGFVDLKSESGNIIDCSNSGNITAPQWCGGIIGAFFQQNTSLTIKNCFNSGNISGENIIGGIAGGSNGSIIECFNKANVECEKANGGGIAGINYNYISGCYNTGSIAGIYCIDIGGIAGYNTSYINEGMIEKSFNAGKVTGYKYVGGIAGSIFLANISNCYNQATIEAQNLNSDFVGGITGYNDKSITFTYNTGNILCQGKSTGEISGSNYNNAVVTNSYFDSQMGIIGKAVGNVESTADGRLTKYFIDPNYIGPDANISDKIILPADVWTVGDYLYPRLKISEVDNAAIVFASAIRLADDQKWNSVYSDFLVSEPLNLLWSSDNPDLISISDNYGAVTQTSTEIYVKVNASIDNISKTNYLKVVSSSEPKIKITVKSSGNGNVARGLVNVNDNDIIEIIKGKNTRFTLTPAAGSYLVSATLTPASSTQVTTDINPDYEKGNIIYGIRDVQTDLILNVTFDDINPWDGISSVEPIGINGNYLIYRPSELSWIANNVNSGADDFTGNNFKLMNSLDLGGMNNAVAWMPIGGGNSSNVFNGNFNGNNKVIANCYINLPQKQNVGLFGIIGSSGSVTNIGLTGESIISGDGNVGGIAGLNNGKILRCYNSCDVIANSADGFMGGIAGNNGNNGTITRSLAFGNLLRNPQPADGYTGAITGNNSNTGNNAVSLCYYDKQITVNGNSKGIGINTDVFGNAYGLLTIEMASGIAHPDFDTANVWYYANGLYPRLKGSFSEESAIVSSTPIFFLNEQNIDNVKNNFYIQNVNGVVWQSNNSSTVNVSSSEGIAIVKRPIINDVFVTLTGKLPNGTINKKYRLTVKSTNSDLITLKITVSDGGSVYGPDGNLISGSGEFQLTTEESATISLMPDAGFYVLKTESSIGNVTDDVTDKLFPAILKDFLVYQTDPVSENISINITFAPISSWTASSVPVKPHSNSSVYYIYRPEELAWLALEVNKGNNFFNNTFKIINNLDLGGNNLQNWIPIGGGAYGRDVSFNGILSGNNKTINNIYINYPSNNYIGLFGSLGAGSTMNSLNLSDCNINGNNYVGALAGFKTDIFPNYTINIDNCIIVSGSISGNDYIGGIIGYNTSNSEINSSINNAIVNGDGLQGMTGGISGFNDGIIKNCINNGEISGGTGGFIGGIAGYNRGGGNKSLLELNINNGKVTGDGNYTGGIAGFNDGSSFVSMINWCLNNGEIIGVSKTGGICGDNWNGYIFECFNTGNITGSGDFIGGISGNNQNREIFTCFNSGTIKGQNNVGGISGSNGNSANVYQCYNTGPIRGNLQSSNNIGGITGLCAGQMTDCYNSGAVIGNNNLGPITGLKTGGSIQSCFYDNQMCTVTNPTDIPAYSVMGLSTNIMTSTKFQPEGNMPFSKWYYEKGFYPQLINFANSRSGNSTIDIIAETSSKVSVSSAILNSEETYSAVRSSFSINSHPNEVWSSSNSAIVPQNGTATVINNSNNDVNVTLTLTNGNISKEFPFTILQTLDSWNVFKTTGDWNNPNNWSKGVLPNSLSNVEIITSANINSGTDAVCNNMIISSAGKITVNGGASLSVNKILNGSIPSKVVFNNTITESTAFIMSDKSYPAPNATINQTIKAGSDNNKENYQLISIPVPNIMGQNVIDIFRGAFLDRYDQQSAMWQRYGNSEGFPVGSTVERLRGYSVNFEVAPHILKYEGQLLNNGAQYLLTYNKNEITSVENGVSVTEDYGGLNLIGNPFMGAIDITKITPYFGNDFEHSVWVWSETNGNYFVYPLQAAGIGLTDNMIPALQGFWVRLYGPQTVPDNIPEPTFNNAVLQIPYESAVINPKPALKNIAAILSFVRLTVNGPRYGDEVIIAATNGCTTGYNNGWDGKKWQGLPQAPQLYAMENDLKLTVDVKGEIKETYLGFKPGESSNYTITLNDNSNNVRFVKVKDLKTGLIHDLKSKPFSFKSEKGDPVKRFMVITELNDGQDNLSDINNINVFSYDKTVIINNAEGMLIQISDITGRVIKEITGGNLINTVLNKSGVYVVRVWGENKDYSTKVIIR